jgi:hypothetical protein
VRPPGRKIGDEQQPRALVDEALRDAQTLSRLLAREQPRSQARSGAAADGEQDRVAEHSPARSRQDEQRRDQVAPLDQDPPGDEHGLARRDREHGVERHQRERGEVARGRIAEVGQIVEHGPSPVV